MAANTYLKYWTCLVKQESLLTTHIMHLDRQLDPFPFGDYDIVDLCQNGGKRAPNDRLARQHYKMSYSNRVTSRRQEHIRAGHY